MSGLKHLWKKRTEAIERRYFDAAFYKQSYADVASTNVDGFSHFMTHGWREGRNPSENFVTLYYRDSHLEGQRINPLTHYAVTGAKNALSTIPPSETHYVQVQAPLVRPHFSEAFYRSQGLAVEGDLLQHYLRIGWRDHIRPNHTLDAHDYLARNSYLRSLDVSPLYHFASQKRFYSHREDLKIQERQESLRSNMLQDSAIRDLIAREFDEAFYLFEYSDVRRAKVDPLAHFLNHGWRENRAPNRYFDCGYYLRENPEVARSGINPFHHFIAVGRSLGLRPNPIGLKSYPPMKAPANAQWRDLPSAADADAAECVVIMPVYEGREETLESIHAVLKAQQKTRYALLVVNDCSPDVELVAALEGLKEQSLFLYEANPVNLGFVATVNAGMRRFPDKDVVLLNADTRVFGDWLDRFVAHARRDPSIATITPFSNNATIFSYPLRNTNNTLEMELDMAGLDRLAAECNADRSCDAPVGVGFCLYISAMSRAAIGLFDEETFGRGYGDENDFSSGPRRLVYAMSSPKMSSSITSVKLLSARPKKSEAYAGRSSSLRNIPNIHT